MKEPPIPLSLWLLFITEVLEKPGCGAGADVVSSVESGGTQAVFSVYSIAQELDLSHTTISC